MSTDNETNNEQDHNWFWKMEYCKKHGLPPADNQIWDMVEDKYNKRNIVKEFAAILNGREYGKEITIEEEKLARENNLVVVFGASDDLFELRGVIYDEIDCYNGGEILVTKDGILSISDEEQEVLEKYSVFQDIVDKAIVINAIWDKDGYSWTYKTDIPHETFDIMDGGEKYCRGIIFSLDSI